MATAPDPKVRFLLRPTVVGQAIMDRLGAPGVDRAAESRRWIELGFAAEQAGFRMDGPELRHADRSWHVQPDLTERVLPNVVLPRPREANQEVPQPATQQIKQMPSPAPTLRQEAKENSQVLDGASGLGESMVDRLRKLSG